MSGKFWCQHMATWIQRAENIQTTEFWFFLSVLRGRINLGERAWEERLSLRFGETVAGDHGFAMMLIWTAGWFFPSSVSLEETHDWVDARMGVHTVATVEKLGAGRWAWWKGGWRDRPQDLGNERKKRSYLMSPGVNQCHRFIHRMKGEKRRFCAAFDVV